MISRDALRRTLSVVERVAYLEQIDKKQISGFRVSDDHVRDIVNNHFGGDEVAYKKFLNCLGARRFFLPYIFCEDVFVGHKSDPRRTKMWDASDRTERVITADQHLTCSPGVEALCRPAISYAIFRLSRILAILKPNRLPLNDTFIIRDIRRYLVMRLNEILAPALALEANIARLKNASLAKSADERYRIYLSTLETLPFQQCFWNQNPVLWRQVSTVVLNVGYACAQTLIRLARDYRRLALEFEFAIGSPLISIDWGKGDSHQRGRAVAVCDFSGKLVIYKPRSLAVDVFVNNFIKWFSAKPDSIALANYCILDRGSYGYVSYIEHRPMLSSGDANIFYTKIGALVGIAWVLGISDLHNGNLIACGTDPILVDVEAALEKSPRLPRSLFHYDKLWWRVFQVSLLKTGLIPRPIAGARGICDTSAIGGVGMQVAPFTIERIEGLGTDNVRLVSHEGIYRQEKNAPQIGDSAVDPSDYIEAILCGFDNAIKVFIQNKFELLSRCGYLLSNGLIKARWLARGTQDYVNLLQGAVHPAVTHSVAASDMIFGRLIRSLEHLGHYKKLISGEVQDLREGDVPYFETSADSVDLKDSRGRTIANFFQRTAFVQLKQRVEILHLVAPAQREIIKSSLTCVSKINKPQFHRNELNIPPVTRDHLVNLAAKIGKDLADRALLVQGIPFWVGNRALDEERATIDILEPTLYEGAPGIGLFFGYLFLATGDKKFLELSRSVHKSVRLLLRRPDLQHRCGAYGGLSGLLYVEMVLGDILQDRSPGSFPDVFRRLEAIASQDSVLDVVGGVAGLLVVALRWHSRYGCNLPINAAMAAADRLKTSAERQKVGVAWPTTSVEAPRLGGLAHGVSGIGWALGEWASETGDELCRGLARDAFLYQQSLFDPEEETWQDLRHARPSYGWCHGAPGIALSAFMARTSLGETVYKNIVNTAQSVMWENRLQQSHCLCHGALGNIEIYRMTGDNARVEQNLEEIVTQHYREGRWRCGLPAMKESYGLMCGLAGIGYGLLRCAYPHTIPNVLALEGPMGCKLA